MCPLAQIPYSLGYLVNSAKLHFLPFCLLSHHQPWKDYLGQVAPSAASPAVLNGVHNSNAFEKSFISYKVWIWGSVDKSQVIQTSDGGLSTWLYVVFHLIWWLPITQLLS